MTKEAEDFIRDEYDCAADDHDWRRDNPRDEDADDESVAAECEWCGEEILDDDRMTGIITDDGREIFLCEACIAEMSAKDVLDLLGRWYCTGPA